MRGRSTTAVFALPFLPSNNRPFALLRAKGSPARSDKIEGLGMTERGYFQMRYPKEIFLQDTHKYAILGV